MVNYTQICLFYLLLLTLFSPSRGDSCQIQPDNSNHWPEFPPIITNELGELLLPVDNAGTREIQLAENEVAQVSCPGSEFDHETFWDQGPLNMRCKNGNSFEVWMDGMEDEADTLQFEDLGCRAQPVDNTEIVDTCGPFGLAANIAIGFDTNPGTTGTETVTLYSCHDLAGARTLYSKHMLWDENRNRDHGNDSPQFNPDSYFDFDVNKYYTMSQQHDTIAELVGSDALADKYVQDFDSGLFLARGHLAPNADFIFYSWMDSSYHFVNVAPQWQSFNGGNWMYFENGCRDFVDQRGIDLVVYTGTHGVCELEDINGNMVEIFLYNGNELPVPRYYWKVMIDEEANAGVAVVGVNNPHLTSIPDDYYICPPIANHPILDNVFYQDNIERGVIWACRVEDLALVVEEVPELPPVDLLV